MSCGSACSFERKRRTRAEMRARHGTPHEFAVAAWRAYSDLMVTLEEAKTAVANYERAYADAPER